jgi:hypothetical protein
MSFVDVLKRARVLATHLLTWLLILQTILTAAVASGNLDQFPEILRWCVVILAGVGSAIAVIRKVTPVPKNQRGLLPKP